MSTAQQEPRRWPAPRTAYELAAEWAAELAAYRGGADGPLSGPPPEIGKAWHDLGPAEQHDVLVALGAQARAALWTFREERNIPDDMTMGLNDGGIYSLRMCEHALESARNLMHPVAGKPWKMPECPHCAALMATLLIFVQEGIMHLSGIADTAAVLRILAARPLAPRQREVPGAEKS
jgi:hypothetical protein